MHFDYDLMVQFLPLITTGLPKSNTICVLYKVDWNNTRFYYAQKT